MFVYEFKERALKVNSEEGHIGVNCTFPPPPPPQFFCISEMFKSFGGITGTLEMWEKLLTNW